MKTFFDCWAEVAGALFSQALAGEPELAESLPKPLANGSFGWAATLAGDIEGKFQIFLDGSVLDVPLMGEGADQKAGWCELVRETVDAAAGELLARTGQKCQVVRFEESTEAFQAARGLQLRSGEKVWPILVRDEVRAEGARAVPEPERPGEKNAGAISSEKEDGERGSGNGLPALSAGLELLLDVELEASLRFGSREMPLGEILDLGPGDVVELDRHVSDPVDLIVGDKIVARGEVVLMNGNFGLSVTEVASPKKRLESVRCLF